MVTQMRGARLDEEMHRVTQILGAADIELRVEGDYRLNDTSLLTENVLSMCLKEAVTNVVKHSKAQHCTIDFTSTPTDFSVKVSDDGVGMTVRPGYYRGNGLRGMKERLEFVNGSLIIRSDIGTELNITVPHVVKRPIKEELSE